MAEQNGRQHGLQDGSSIKPVSSLLSHFEQMTTNAPEGKHDIGRSRPVSPRPKPPTLRSKPVALVPITTGNYLVDLKTLQPTVAAGSAVPPKPRPRSMITTPALTINPPSSPSRADDNLHNIAVTPGSLTVSSPATPGLSSPSVAKAQRHSESSLTLKSEPQISRISLIAQPPEPPPPRRSGEMRRPKPEKDGTRGPTPGLADRSLTLDQHNQSSRISISRSSVPSVSVSPFSSPPSSPDSSPDPVVPPSRNHSMAAMSPRPAGDVPQSKPTLPMRHTSVASDTARQIADEKFEKVSSTAVSRPDPLHRGENSRTTIGRAGVYDTHKKRISSTPTRQLTPSPRHSRSATVDQGGRHITREGRHQSPAGQGISLHRSASVMTTSDTFPTKVAYPDISKSNRRPPQHKQGPTEFQLRSDSRMFDVCGEHICTTGSMTRAWSLRTGEQVFSCVHPEGIIVKSLSFKPASEAELEGSRIWLGNNIGELLEIDLRTGATMSKVNAHARHEVIKIYRHNLDLWTLDDVGTLHVWPSTTTSEPSLDFMSNTHRVPKGHSFSMVVDDELWHAVGKELRVFRPTPDGKTQFQVLQRPISQSSAGDITAGTVLSGQRDRVYIGHNDGRISIYAKTDYSCLGVVNVSLFKINAMTGEGDYLWTGHNTGMIHVYDTTQVPWLVKKDWRAHDNPVTSLLRDRAGFWKMDRSQIISLGVDNRLAIWDGMLQEDWLELEMQDNDIDYCQFENIRATIVTWNAGAALPPSLRHDEQSASFLTNLCREGDTPDILVFGFQELVDLEDKKSTAKSFFKSKRKDQTGHDHMSHQYRDWLDHLVRSLDTVPSGEGGYHMLHSSNLVGLFTCIFVKSRYKSRIRNLHGAEVKRGMGGLHGNKGALLVRFTIADTSICFVNCHLAAGQSSTKDRNYDITEILESRTFPAERDSDSCIDRFIGGGDGSMVMDHELCILNGDLNYRIDTMSRDAVVNAVNSGNLSRLLERDQLLVSKRKNPTFRLRAFEELPIGFKPTYKYDIGQNRYDTSEKRRSPAWCDRILYRSRDPSQLQQLDYRRHEVKVSDHRPVSGRFSMKIKTISQSKRALAWNGCRQRLDERRVEWALDSMTEYLTVSCGYDLNSALKMIKDSYGARRK